MYSSLLSYWEGVARNSPFQLACLSLTRTDVSRPADLDGSGCDSRVEFAKRNTGEPAATIIRINFH